MDTLIEYILQDRLSSKNLWKKFVNEHVYEHYNTLWRDNVITHGQLAMFAQIYPIIEVSISWLIGNSHPDHLEQINDLLRLIRGYFEIKEKRVNKPEKYRNHCHICNNDYVNTIEHALLYCRGSSQPREELWEWINDIVPIEIAVYLAN